VKEEIFNNFHRKAFGLKGKESFNDGRDFLSKRSLIKAAKNAKN
jgi:hypothetical protein